MQEHDSFRLLTDEAVAWALVALAVVAFLLP